MMQGSLKFSMALAFLGVGSAPLLANEAVQPIVEKGETLVLVEAVGSANVAPDYMWIEVGVVTTGKTASETLDANNRRMFDLLEILKSNGIIPSKIQTSDFDVSPEYKDDGDSDTPADIVGYKVVNEVRVEFRDFDRAGDIISALFGAGANSVSGPRFNIDEATYIDAAERAEAMALVEARRRVDNVAKALELNVSRTLRVSNVDINFDRKFGRRGGQFIVVTGSRIAPTPIEPGELTVEAEVFVEYALVDN